ncbi:MAG TPA: VOC family protein [Candidatus Latescibacteria bacterium]|jgi:catechol 2,3-dioxygenase-like lactoylglutathione lyase family enzyme|nr:glyoxalase [Gemmatimonadaceae bacterium]MDP6014626.1 VOC family protein [Candidatus Latescibacterota bacterium]HJP30128.1 VOC family protein [Candidatus Latescibacterota bacterium]
MLAPVRELAYVIILCDDIGRMKAFYRNLLPFEVDSESETSLSLRAGGVLLGLRQRTRGYDGVGARQESPGLQLAFRVEPEQVEPCHEQLVAMGVTVLEPTTDQWRGHRTVYFADPEGNVLEVYAEI